MKDIKNVSPHRKNLGASFRLSISPSCSNNLDLIAKEIGEFVKEKFPEAAFTIIFGSRILDKDGQDIDFKIFFKVSPSAAQRDVAANFAILLHKKHAPQYILNNTSDVPYSIKTIVDPTVLSHALKLDPFINSEGNFYISPIHLTPEFLKSDICQMRTSLSALTTPHVYILGGDFEEYSRTKKEAFVRIFNLISKLYNIPTNMPNKIIDKLLYAPDGRSYKEYLGYRDCLSVKENLLNHYNEYMECYEQY